MFFAIFINAGHSLQRSASTTEALGELVRRQLFHRSAFDTVMVSVGTEEACMPFAELYKQGKQWRCRNEGDCIRLGLKQDELPEDRDPMWTALERGDVVVHEPRGDAIDTERLGDMHLESRRIANVLLGKAKASE